MKGQQHMLTDEVQIIEARDLQVGDVIHHNNKVITVKTLERGQSCTGVHVNVVRRDTRAIKKNGKVVGLNADRGAMMYSDGCFGACLPLVISRATA